MVKWDLVSFVSRSKQRKQILPLLKEPITPSAIAKRSGLYSTHVSRALKEFEKKKLVECLTPNERVGKLYKITKQGLEILKELQKLKD